MYAERVPVEPKDPRFIISFDYAVTLKIEGKNVAGLTWSEHLRRHEE
jgi:hypothetical protein